MSSFPSELFAQSSQSDNGLLDWLRPRIDDSMLQKIAAADYGQWEKKHLRALRKIRDTGVLPSPLHSEPMEVLILVSFSEPDDPQWKSGSGGERGHLMRAFCCAVILQAAAEMEMVSHGIGESGTLIQLTASVLMLGREPSFLALRFLWNRASTLSEENLDRPFFAFAILLLCASKHELVDDAEVREIAQWVLMEEAEGRKRYPKYRPTQSPEWLLGLTYSDIFDDAWRKLAQEILLDLPRENKETAAVLREIGRRIVDGSAVNETE